MKTVKLEINRIVYDSDTQERITSSYTFRNINLINKLWDMICNIDSDEANITIQNPQ